MFTRVWKHESIFQCMGKKGSGKENEKMKTGTKKTVVELMCKRRNLWAMQ